MLESTFLRDRGQLRVDTSRLSESAEIKAVPPFVNIFSLVETKLEASFEMMKVYVSATYARANRGARKGEGKEIRGGKDAGSSTRPRFVFTTVATSELIEGSLLDECS